MKKIVIIAGIVILVVAGVLFIVIPLATSKMVESRLSEAFDSAGIPEEIWNVGSARYFPIPGRIVIKNLVFGDDYEDFQAKVKRLTFTSNLKNTDIFKGSARAKKVLFLADEVNISVGSICVNGFMLDLSELNYGLGMSAVKKLKNIRVNNVEYKQRGSTYFSLKKMNTNIGYTHGKIPLSTSISMKDLILDVRRLLSISSGLNTEYRFSNLSYKNKISKGVSNADLDITLADLFNTKINIVFSFPPEFDTSGSVENLAMIDFEEDLKMVSLVFNYNDKSFLDHILRLAKVNKKYAVEMLNETFMEMAIMSGFDSDRFVKEATNFIVKPKKLELKIIPDYPLSLNDITDDLFDSNLSLSINGGKPFRNNQK